MVVETFFAMGHGISAATGVTLAAGEDPSRPEHELAALPTCVTGQVGSHPCSLNCSACS